MPRRRPGGCIGACVAGPPNSFTAKGAIARQSSGRGLFAGFDPPPAADLSLVVSDKPDPVKRGNDLIYTLRVTNGGPDLASRVVLTDVLPGSVKLESATATQGTCTARGKKGGTVNCQLGDEANGQTVTVTIIGRATGKGAISNKATVMAAAPPDPATASNTAIETTTVAR